MIACHKKDGRIYYFLIYMIYYNIYYITNMLHYKDNES